MGLVGKEHPGKKWDVFPHGGHKVSLVDSVSSNQIDFVVQGLIGLSTKPIGCCRTEVMWVEVRRQTWVLVLSFQLV